MQVLGGNDVGFAREARDLVFQYSLRMSRASTWQALMESLDWVYAREHSFTFFINGDKAGQTFHSLKGWEASASDEMKNNYQNGRYVMSNLMVFPDQHRIEYVAYQIRDGRVVSQDLVMVTLVREDGRLRYKHADIHYEFL